MDSWRGGFVCILWTFLLIHTVRNQGNYISTKNKTKARTTCDELISSNKSIFAFRFNLIATCFDIFFSRWLSSCKRTTGRCSWTVVPFLFPATSATTFIRQTPWTFSFQVNSLRFWICLTYLFSMLVLICL